MDNITLEVVSDRWSAGSHWSVYNNDQFRCYGGGTAVQQTLTSNEYIDLSDYAGQTVGLSVYVSDSNSESGDILYYQLYNSSGWSSQQLLYEGNYSSGTYTISIPEAYLTSQFSIQFYWSTSRTDEYVYIDDITIYTSTGKWSAGSHWSVYNSDQFRCYGGGTAQEQTLILNEDIDLSDYERQQVNFSVYIDESDAENSDILYYRLHKSSGWSGQEQIFNGDYEDGIFTITIPEAYLTSQFRIQFYWYADNTGDYVYLDDIEIRVTVL
jgi:hypothetical protein